MPYYRVVARYLAYAEQIVGAESATDARMKAMNEWPDGQWRSQYGGAELKPPDGAHLVSHEIMQCSEAEERRIEDRLSPEE